MSRIQDSIRSMKASQAAAKKAKPSIANKRLESVSGLKFELPKSIGDIPREQRIILNSDHLAKSRIIHEESALNVVTPYKMLRTRVLQNMDRSGSRVLAVSASHESAGKTITAINLAIMVARSSGRSVYLLDLDLRKPGVARSLGIDNVSAGIGDFLAGDKKFEEVLWNVGIDNLFVAASRGRFDNSSELLVSNPMTDLISAIRADASHPIIIIDLPPVLAADDALAVTPVIDSLLFVVAEGETKRSDIMHSLELLRDVNLLGVVLNNSRDARPGY
jgi:capsular exopolysaccharide synthesis family protein